MKDKVSIIVPVYNSENYLNDCIYSLINQTYENIEIILVDDGSKDNSYRICRKFAAKYRNIVLKKHEVNKSQAIARNTGIESSTGSWLIFVDSDDTLCKDAIAVMMEKTKNDEVDIVLSSFARKINGCILSEYKNVLQERSYLPSEIAALLFDKIPLNIVSCIGTKLYRSSIIKNNGLLFGIEYKFNEDGAFAIMAFNYAKLIAYIDKPIYIYLYRENYSTQSSYRDGMYFFIANARTLIKNFLVTHGCYGDKIVKYNIMHLELIRDSLLNEIRYKGTYNKIYNVIVEREQTFEMINILKNIDLKIDLRFILYCLTNNRRYTLYLFIKLLECALSYKKKIELSRKH